ncbi:MAG TPA: hypothetical protein VL307_00045, partial [Chitinophagaceae bacterium]|nr:hypothetical protein [Chitinophagaceae bacterium]
MDEKKQIDHPDQAAPLQLPMGQLFYLLYRNGFTVKPDDYIEMLKITERFGSTSIDETAQWICPIIASNETEQLRFYHVVEEYKKQVAAAAEEPVKRKLVPKRAIAIALVTLLLLVALGMYLSGPKPLELSAEPLKERTVKRGLPVSLDASPLLRGHEQDSANIEFAWQFENKIEKRGLRVAHVFYSPGDFIVKRTFSSTKRRLARDTDSLLVHVCNDLPQVSINLPPEAVNIDEPVNLTATVVADTGTVTFYQWTVRDSVFTTQMPEASNIVFTATGDYPVSCKAVVGAVEAPCSVTDTKIITVQNKGRRFVANVSAGGITYAAGKPGLKWWVTLALLLPAGAAVMYSLFKRKPKPAAKETAGKKTISSSAGPFDVPFEQNDTALIQPEKELRRGFTQMKFKAEEEQLVLSVGGTINSIIRSGGSPQLVYAPQIKPQQYMLLIDRSNPKSMLTQLFTWLSRAMEEEGIPVTTFFYDDRFTCYNENYPAGTALQKLAETYNAATLIILGKCHQFIYPIYPQIEEQYLKTLQQWQNKVIITPLPLQDWNAKERILQQYLLLLPADAVFFQKMIPLLREKSRPRNEVLALEATAQGILKEYDARSISNLRQYLGNNEVLFQWLCAICVYPRLRWEVLVEVGEAILTKYGQPSLLNYNNLLLLARIPWMQQGVFPQVTRLELLKELSIEN